LNCSIRFPFLRGFLALLMVLTGISGRAYSQATGENRSDPRCEDRAPRGLPCLADPRNSNIPWSGYGHDPQHTAMSAVAAQALSSIHWQTPVDLNPPGGGQGDLSIHYGSPVVTAGNTVIVPVKTGATDGFQLEAFNGATGSPLYTLPTDYSLPGHNWTPPYGPALSLGTRLYYAGAGGTLLYRDLPNSPRGPNRWAGATGRVAFYGTALYNNNRAAFNGTVQISTPLTTDRSGNVFFGFTVTGPNPAGLASGIARVSFDGVGTWVGAVSLSGDISASSIALNCAPALSNDQRTAYVAASTGEEFGSGYLVSMNAATLAPIARVRLFDPRGGLAIVSTDSSAAPTVAPDGDVYYGVLENPCCSSHNDRGWLLHFNFALTQTKIPGSFGWDDTASVVPSNAVPSYTGTSSYLILTKYNNYAGSGTGDGVNKVAILDPSASMQDPYSTAPVTVLQEVITVTGVTPESAIGFPNAVREWCIDTVAIDPVTRSAIVNSNDGVVYRWDFTGNTLPQRLRLTAGRSEAYTPTAIGPDGTVYAINDAILFAIGN
jgi:hypothetical protein